MDIRTGTKRAEEIISEHEYVLRNYGERGLVNCYAKPSARKIVAFDNCRDVKRKYNGFNGTITSFNTNQFSYTFNYVDDTDGTLHTVKITRDNIYNVG